MKKNIFILISALTILLLYASPASAHVVVTPQTALPAERVTFSVSVPNEKEMAVTGLRLEMPAGLQSVTPTVHPGWTIDITKDGDTVKEISWSGGEIPSGQRDDFTFRVQLPETSGEIKWKAYQTYADGSVVAWNQDPSDDTAASENEDTGPYSVTQIEEETTTNVVDNSSGSDVIPLVASLVAVIASIIAVRKSSRKDSSQPR